ncbi:MAG: RNB domain-containing ribonuclease [Micavibrio aeruginosavorus]|uniref:RNB domain-containing ribonuclease n=1 Tax=Micavibrio aeruginosavorus TaxID=349221 RepID=A0A7T5UHN7_9BACT|nr:MAG: RNB domain-containing ribonuclease [Micavibrio aeruginosavorus]
MSDKSGLLPSVTKERLYQWLAMNPSPLSRAALLTLAGAESHSAPVVDGYLKELMDEKRVVMNGRRGYQAVWPWSDIAYATVGTIQGHRRVPVTISLLPADTGIAATLSHADITKNKLQEGDRIVVALRRGDGATLRAQFLAHMHQGRPYRLSGTFNRKSCVFTPLDRSIKGVFVLPDAPDKEAKHHFLAEFPPDFDIRHPVMAVTGDQARDLDTGRPISIIIAMKHQIAHSHPGHVLKEAHNLNRRKLRPEQRVDLRHLDFHTVDPLGSTDLDDAFATEKERDGYSLYTAIADVPALVHYNTAVDREAYRRGVTFYLKDRTSHMLPPVLSTNKCSLVANADRPAIIVRQRMDWDCNMTGYEVFAGIIRTREQLTYGQFYDLMERDDPRFRLIKDIHDTRRRRGLNEELRALLKENPEAFASKSIIETLMVQTNALVAKFLLAAQVPFLSRNFEQPQNGDAASQRAYYSSQSLGHAGLGQLYYAHVSSPIRRYADIINLRALHKALGTKGIGIGEEEIARLDESASHLNDRRRIERDVQHDYEKYHAIPDLKRLQAAPVRVFINEIGNDYVEVSILQTGVRQRLMLPDFQGTRWRVDGPRSELVLLDASGVEARRYHRGESLLGQICNVDPASAKWELLLIPTEPQLRSVVKAGSLSP